jgi:hypothetical protein
MPFNRLLATLSLAGDELCLSHRYGCTGTSVRTAAPFCHEVREWRPAGCQRGAAGALQDWTGALQNMKAQPSSLFYEKWKARLSPRTLYFAAMACAVFLCVIYLVSLSVGISYDGHVYIDLADMLGTARFFKEWNPARTPLFPLALKISFWLFGKQALALIVVMSAAGVAGILILGIIVKELAGYLAGAITMIAVSLFPTFVTYERMVLTETGTFLILACMVLLSLWIPVNTRSAWWKTLGLALVCCAGYYWRQNLLSMAYWLALLHLIAWRTSLPGKLPGWKDSRLTVTLAQCILIVLVPNVGAHLWTPYANNSGVMDLVLRFGIVKQAVPDPEDRFIGPDEQFYESAIQTSLFHGHLYSGLRADLDTQLAEKVFSRYSGSARDLFIRLIRDYPGRYAAAVGRTALLFAGAKGLQDESEIFRDQILSPNFPGARIGGGPEPLTKRNRDYFALRAQPSAVQVFLRKLVGFYDFYLTAGFIVCIVGLVLSVAWLDFRLFAFTATPFVYLVPYLVILLSVDRYAFPAYPFILASPLVVGVALARRISGRQKVHPPQDKPVRIPRRAQA